MFNANAYIPTRVLFGAGSLEKLAGLELPGKKAIICAGPMMEKTGILARVLRLLEENAVEAVLYAAFTPNPLKSSVTEAAALARALGCDFVIGLGGGSSIDAAKAVAILLANPGDLWDYAMAGSGGRKEVSSAFPVVAISTTSGTGTETDFYSVITHDDTREKLDFSTDEIFPKIAIIDPELMTSLPRDQTVFQGFDALFHAAECYITNENQNRLVSLFVKDSIETLVKWLPVAATEPDNLEARSNVAYAADILSGWTQALVGTTSHHIIAQTMGGLFQGFPHGAALLAVAEQYYTKLCALRPQLLDELGAFMGEARDSTHKGYSFVTALAGMMEALGVRGLPMSRYGVGKEDLTRIADITVDVVGIDFESYTLTKADVLEILEASYR